MDKPSDSVTFEELQESVDKLMEHAKKISNIEITQAQLYKILELESEAEALNITAKEMREAVLFKIKQGASVESGEYYARRKAYDRPYPNWSNLYKRDMGEEAYTREYFAAPTKNVEYVEIDSIRGKK